MDNKKFSLCKGCYVLNLEGIYECYSVKKNEQYFSYTINVNFENITSLIEDFISIIRTPGFFVIEVPTNLNDEKELRKDETEPFHSDVYYLDGGSNKDFIILFRRYKELLINDGCVKFGFGSHEGYDELFIQDYKIFNIFTDEPNKYEIILNKRGFVKQEIIKTVWENISKDNPGQSVAMEINNESVYDIIKNLKETGLYFAERRERF